MIQTLNKPQNLLFYTNYSLQHLTTIKIGGRAFYYARLHRFNELVAAITFAREQHLPFFILGNGSNVLLSDDDFNGLVIQLHGELGAIEFHEEEGTVTAGSGALLMELGNEIAERGYLGCAYMGVIPGTVGGAVRMNAGTLEEGEIKDQFLHADVFDPETGAIITYTGHDMCFGYRTCALSRSRKIILKTTFKLPSRKEIIPGAAREIVISLRARRHRKQPKNFRNFGSTFKRPPEGKPPGWYLERVGMKGMRKGGAMVSEEHANWILNVDNAKSADVKYLIAEGQRRVFDEFGIQLQREVIYLPEDIAEWT